MATQTKTEAVGKKIATSIVGNITEPQTNKMSTCLIPIKDTVTPNSKHGGFKVLCLGRTLHSHR